jgi:uncharacterized membrane protein
LYQIALEFRENIEDFYMIQKSTGEIKRIRLFRHLNDNEKNIIQIISEKPGLSIGELQKIFKMKYGKGNLTFIWRTVMKLIQEKLVKDEKKGREVKIALTDEGSSFVYTREYDKILLPLFRE